MGTFQGTLLFLMHRVELKVAREVEFYLMGVVKFLMHRVELKARWMKTLLIWTCISPFLMHRVELKVQGTPSQRGFCFSS